MADLYEPTAEIAGTNGIDSHYSKPQISVMTGTYIAYYSRFTQDEN